MIRFTGYKKGPLSFCGVILGCSLLLFGCKRAPEQQASQSELDGYGPNTNDESFTFKARPTDMKFNAVAMNLFTKETFVQQDVSESKAIKAALRLCADRSSETGFNGGCVIKYQFTARLLPRADGEPSRKVACKIQENRPIADGAVNRAWGAASNEDFWDAYRKAEKRCAKKAGIECQILNCTNSEFGKSEILVSESLKDQPDYD